MRNLKFELPDSTWTIVVKALYLICFFEGISLETQTRLFISLQHLLLKQRSRELLTLDWRPFWRLLSSYYLGYMSPNTIMGENYTKSHMRGLTHLISLCGWYFPQESVGEIINTFSPFFVNAGTVTSFSALAALYLFTPPFTTAKDLPPGTLEYWIEVWSTVENCNDWDVIWFSIFSFFASGSRMFDAEYDENGNVTNSGFPWGKHVPFFFSRIQSLFNLSIDGTSPEVKELPADAFSLLQGIMPCKVDTASRFIIRILTVNIPPTMAERRSSSNTNKKALQQASQETAETEVVDSSVQGKLEQLLRAVSSFFYPTSSQYETMIGFLQSLTSAFCSRLGREAGIVTAKRFLDKGGIPMPKKSYLGYDLSASDLSFESHPMIGEERVKRFVDSALPLAVLGLYRPGMADDDMGVLTCLSDLAQLAPQRVCKELVTMATRALDPSASNQTHQAPNALSVLEHLTPRLMYPVPHLAPFLGNLLQLSIPGIDPSDFSKTCHTLRFCNRVFEAIPLLDSSKIMNGSVADLPPWHPASKQFTGLPVGVIVPETLKNFPLQPGLGAEPILDKEGRPIPFTGAVTISGPGDGGSLQEMGYEEDSYFEDEGTGSLPGGMKRLLLASRNLMTELPDIFIMYMEKLLHLLETLDSVPDDSHNTVSTLKTNLFEEFFTFTFSQMDSVVFKRALGVLSNWLKNVQPLDGVVIVRRILTAITSAAPETVKTLIPMLTKAALMEGASKERVNWYATLLHGCAGVSGEYLLPYVDDLMKVIDRTMKEEKENSWIIGCKLLTSLLSSFVDIRLKSASFAAHNPSDLTDPSTIWMKLWKPYSWLPQGTDDQLKKGLLPTPLEVQWDSPSSDTRAAALSILNQYLMRSLHSLLEFSDAIKNSEAGSFPVHSATQMEDVRKQLLLVKHSLMGASVVLTDSIGVSGDDKILRCGTSNNALIVMDGFRSKEAVYSTLDDSYDWKLSQGPLPLRVAMSRAIQEISAQIFRHTDLRRDFKALELVSNICFILFSYRGHPYFTTKGKIHAEKTLSRNEFDVLRDRMISHMSRIFTSAAVEAGAKLVRTNSSTLGGAGVRSRHRMTRRLLIHLQRRKAETIFMAPLYCYYGSGIHSTSAQTFETIAHESDTDSLEVLEQDPYFGRNWGISRPGTLQGCPEELVAVASYCGLKGALNYPKADIGRAIVISVFLNLAFSEVSKIHQCGFSELIPLVQLGPWLRRRIARAVQVQARFLHDIAKRWLSNPEEVLVNPLPYVFENDYPVRKVKSPQDSILSGRFIISALRVGLHPYFIRLRSVEPLQQLVQSILRFKEISEVIEPEYQREVLAHLLTASATVLRARHNFVTPYNNFGEKELVRKQEFLDFLLNYATSYSSVTEKLTPESVRALKPQTTASSSDTSLYLNADGSLGFSTAPFPPSPVHWRYEYMAMSMAVVLLCPQPPMPAQLAIDMGKPRYQPQDVRYAHSSGQTRVEPSEGLWLWALSNVTSRHPILRSLSLDMLISLLNNLLEKKILLTKNPGVSTLPELPLVRAYLTNSAFLSQFISALANERIRIQKSRDRQIQFSPLDFTRRGMQSSNHYYDSDSIFSDHYVTFFELLGQVFPESIVPMTNILVQLKNQVHVAAAEDVSEEAEGGSEDYDDAEDEVPMAAGVDKEDITTQRRRFVLVAEAMCGFIRCLTAQRIPGSAASDSEVHLLGIGDTKLVPPLELPTSIESIDYRRPEDIDTLVTFILHVAGNFLESIPLSWISDWSEAIRNIVMQRHPLQVLPVVKYVLSNLLVSLDSSPSSFPTAFNLHTFVSIAQQIDPKMDFPILQKFRNAAASFTAGPQTPSVGSASSSLVTQMRWTRLAQALVSELLIVPELDQCSSIVPGITHGEQLSSFNTLGYPHSAVPKNLTPARVYAMQLFKQVVPVLLASVANPFKNCREEVSRLLSMLLEFSWTYRDFGIEMPHRVTVAATSTGEPGVVLSQPDSLGFNDIMVPIVATLLYYASVAISLGISSLDTTTTTVTATTVESPTAGAFTPTTLFANSPEGKWAKNVMNFVICFAYEILGANARIFPIALSLAPVIFYAQSHVDKEILYLGRITMSVLSMFISVVRANPQTYADDIVPFVQIMKLVQSTFPSDALQFSPRGASRLSSSEQGEPSDTLPSSLFRITQGPLPDTSSIVISLCEKYGNVLSSVPSSGKTTSSTATETEQPKTFDSLSSYEAMNVDEPDLQANFASVDAALKVLYSAFSPTFLTTPSGATSSSWAIRSGVLSFIIGFHARHFLTLSHKLNVACLDMVQSRLSDTQVEVQESATKVLVGILTTLSETDQQRFAKSMLNRLVPRLKKRPPVPASMESLSEAEMEDIRAQMLKYSESLRNRFIGCLGLSALVLAHPFEVPRFVAPVIAALARCASDPVPICQAVKKTLDEFRRTHSDAWEEKHKAVFSQSELEDILGVSAGASYFS